MRFFLSRNRLDPRCIDVGVVWGPRHWSESDDYLAFTGRPRVLAACAAALAIVVGAPWAFAAGVLS